FLFPQLALPNRNIVLSARMLIVAGIAVAAIIALRRIGFRIVVYRCRLVIDSKAEGYPSSSPLVTCSSGSWKSLARPFGLAILLRNVFQLAQKRPHVGSF